MFTAVAYLRISEDPFDKRHGVDRQREDVRLLAERLNARLLHIYEDNDVSASKVRKRSTQWWQVTEKALPEQRPTYLLATTHERLGRMMADLEGLDTLCAKTGTRVILVDGGDLFANPGWPFLSAQAKTEAMRNRDRVKRAHKAKRDKGLPAQGGTRPYGFQPDRMTIVPEEARVLRKIADRIISGESTTSVLRWLTQSGTPTVRGKNWSSTALKQVLRNPRYVGDYAVVRYTEEGRGRHYEVIGKAQWKPILSRPVWEALQAALDERTTTGRPKTLTLLGGILRCSECRRPMHARQSGTKGKRVTYYRCDVSAGGCGTVYRRQPEMDEWATQYVLANVDPFSLEQDREAAATEVRRIRKEWEAAEFRKQDAEYAYDTGRARASALAAADRAAADMVRLHKQLEAARLRLERLNRAETSRERFDAGTLGERRAWLRAAVEVIWCWPVPKGSALDPATMRVDWQEGYGPKPPDSSPVTA